MSENPCFLSGDDEIWWLSSLLSSDSAHIPIDCSAGPLSPDKNAPLCSRCKIPMVIKQNRSTGDKFYGCPNYALYKCKSVSLSGKVSNRSRAYGLPSDLEFAMYDDYIRDMGAR